MVVVFCLWREKHKDKKTHTLAPTNCTMATYSIKRKYREAQHQKNSSIITSMRLLRAAALVASVDDLVEVAEASSPLQGNVRVGEFLILCNVTWM